MFHIDRDSRESHKLSNLIRSKLWLWNSFAGVELQLSCRSFYLMRSTLNFPLRIQGEKIGETNRKTKINNSRAIFHQSFSRFSQHTNTDALGAFQGSLKNFPSSNIPHDICSLRRDNFFSSERKSFENFRWFQRDTREEHSKVTTFAWRPTSLPDTDIVRTTYRNAKWKSNSPEVCKLMPAIFLCNFFAIPMKREELRNSSSC